MEYSETEAAPKRRSRKIGSREEVYNGICERTSGGLRKEDLVFNQKTGKICTSKEIERGRQLAEMMRKKEPEVAPILELPSEPAQQSTSEESPKPTPARKPRAPRKKKITEVQEKE